MLSAPIISELQEILFQEFSYTTSIDEASEIATQLVGYIEALKEINEDNYAKAENK